MTKRILIVDDSSYMRSLINETLTGEGYNIVGMAVDGESAIDLALELKPDIITLDQVLPDMTGMDILTAVKGAGLESLIIMVSAVGQQSTIKEAIDAGASDYIVKPFSKKELLEAIHKMIAKNH
ncbi:MAG: two-component system chemotaxis response regulator CheY [Paraglaciecola sp.]|jgi:two-component system chemotaxis response regulator CheY